MTTHADDSAFFDETAGTPRSQHLNNRNNDPDADASNENAPNTKAHLRIVSIESPNADDDASAPVRSNRVVLALARLVREALEAEDEASDKGAWNSAPPMSADPLLVPQGRRRKPRKLLPRSLDELRGLRAARWVRESTAGQYDHYGPDSQHEQMDRFVERFGLIDKAPAPRDPTPALAS